MAGAHLSSPYYQFSVQICRSKVAGKVTYWIVAYRLSPTGVTLLYRLCYYSAVSPHCSQGNSQLIIHRHVTLAPAHRLSTYLLLCSCQLSTVTIHHVYFDILATIFASVWSDVCATYNMMRTGRKIIFKIWQKVMKRFDADSPTRIIT